MKKVLFLFFASIFYLNAMAQLPVIENASFENWNDVNAVSYPDNWEFSDSLEVQNNYVRKNNNGSDGNYSLHLGSYIDVITVGASTEIYDTLNTTKVGGLGFDCRISHSTYSWSDLGMSIYFYDDNHDYIESISWSSSSTYNSFTPLEWYFEQPATAKYFLLEIYYSNINGSTSEYADVDNLKFLEEGAAISDIADSNNGFISLNKETKNIIFSSNNYNTISIFNIEGVAVLQSEIIGNSIDVSTLKKGVYVVQLSGNSGNLTQKIVID